MLHLRPAGHLLGAALVQLRGDGTTLLFSGDLGRPHDPIMAAPLAVGRVDYLVIESTYGNRRHDPTDPKEKLAEVINRTVKRGGTVIVPAFAVGRAQTLMYLIHLPKEAGRIPDIPVFLNSSTLGAAMLNGAETVKIHGDCGPRWRASTISPHTPTTPRSSTPRSKFG